MKRRLESILTIDLLVQEENEEILELISILPKVKRRKMHAIFENREIEGTFNILVKKYLMLEEDKFFDFFRVPPRIFHFMLDHIRAEIETLPCNRVRQPITSEHKLCLALRYRMYIFRSSILRNSLNRHYY